MMDLSEAREKLDLLDAQIVRLFEMRMRISRDIALYKHQHRMPSLDPARRDDVLQSRAAMTSVEAYQQPVTDLFTEIMRLSCEEQRRVLDSLCDDGPPVCPKMLKP